MIASMRMLLMWAGVRGIPAHLNITIGNFGDGHPLTKIANFANFLGPLLSQTWVESATAVGNSAKKCILVANFSTVTDDISDKRSNPLGHKMHCEIAESEEFCAFSAYRSLKSAEKPFSTDSQTSQNALEWEE